ncbi:MAG: metallophosphoesterase family protein [Desulfobacteraceae bacterium]|nr:metallophosphoesterase family protein [Desulfobacteraceae bacterium]
MPNHTGLITHIGAIGDIHTEDVNLDLALSFLSEQKLDLIVSVGDIVTGPGDVDRCCDLLQSHSVITVAGNHDRWFLSEVMPTLPNYTDPATVSSQSKYFLNTLPQTHELNSPQGTVLICHGLGTNDMADLKPDDYGYAIEANLELQELIRSKHYRFVVNGHTHCRMVRHFGDLTVINVGTLQRYVDSGFAVIDFESGHVRFFDIEFDGTIVKADSIFLDG